MPTSTFGYHTDCGYTRFQDPRFIVGAGLGILALTLSIAFVLYRTPEQDEAIQRRICEKTGGQWVLDHTQRDPGTLPRRVYGCARPDASAAVR